MQQFQQSNKWIKRKRITTGTITATNSVLFFLESHCHFTTQLLGTIKHLLIWMFPHLLNKRKVFGVHSNTYLWRSWIISELKFVVYMNPITTSSKSPSLNLCNKAKLILRVEYRVETFTHLPNLSEALSFSFWIHPELPGSVLKKIWCVRLRYELSDVILNGGYAVWGPFLHKPIDGSWPTDPRKPLETQGASKFGQ